MRALLVEVADVDAEDVLELAAPNNREAVEGLAAHAADPAFGAFAFGAWIGVRTILIPSLPKMLSKARLNFLSRSWIKNRGRWLRSSRSISRLRACWTVHAVCGLAVHAMYSTRRLPIETKNSTNNRRGQTVSTVKKSQARIVSVFAQERAPTGAGALRCRRDTGAGEHVALPASPTP